LQVKVSVAEYGEAKLRVEMLLMLGEEGLVVSVPQ
jgi:hypothetical protein